MEERYNPMKSAEIATEHNYNMLDGVLNIGYFKGMELQIQTSNLLATSTMQDWLALVHIALSWELMC